VACYVLDTATKGEDDDGYTAAFAGAPACGLAPSPIRVDPVDPLVQLEAGRYYDADGQFIADPSNVSVSFAYMESGAFAEDSGSDRVWLPAGQGSPSESGTWVATFDATDLASGSYLVQASFDFEDGSSETAISSLVVP
jgi:hypothetical protein